MGLVLIVRETLSITHFFERPVEKYMHRNIVSITR